MSRRYLAISEAVSALKRGKDIEIFLGGFSSEGESCIKWASFEFQNNIYRGCIWESYDEGSSEFLDIYSFSPTSGELDEPVKKASSTDFEDLLNQLECPNDKLVNQGIVQDEYADYLKNST